jgi:hypothetical protein
MQNLPTPYQDFIHLSRYARYRDDLGRREMWPETIQRWENFWTQRLVDNFAFSTNEAVDFVAPLSEAVLTPGRDAVDALAHDGGRSAERATTSLASTAHTSRSTTSWHSPKSCTTSCAARAWASRSNGNA